MTTLKAPEVTAIFQDDVIAKLTDGFIGRDWIFKKIDNWLTNQDERFFILTGEPGIGKSAIAAQLTKIRQDIAAHHFCIAGSSGTIEPNNVLLSLAAQLVEYFPDYAETLANIIKPLKLSVNVEITIQNIKDSRVRGVVINNLHTQNPQEALNIILRKTSAALPNPPEQPRLIVIDSLDEAVTFSDRDNLITLLAGLNDLPPWVRLLLTSRPEDRVLVEFEPLKPHRIEEMSKQNLSDISEYVEGRVEQLAFQEKLSKAALVPQTLIDEVTKLSCGNFLYTKLLLNDIEAGRQSLDDLSALPKSIGEIYLAFLKRFKPQEWKSQYQPILGTLTVTQEPITEDELAKFTGIDPGILRQDLGIIHQFLDVVENDEGDTAYTIFHQSLRDYLLDKKRNKYFWCYAQGQHGLIIKYYENVSKAWQQLQKVDRYGRIHLAQHLVKADRVEELHTLLSLEKDSKNAWFKVKDDEGDTAGFLADVELAWSQSDEMYDREPGRSIGLECRYALIKASINSLAKIPVSLMVALVKHGDWEPAKALTQIRQIPYPAKRFQSLLALAELLETGLLKDQVLQLALQAAQDISDKSSRAWALGGLVDKLPPELLPQEVLEAAQSIANESACDNKLMVETDKQLKTQVSEDIQAIQKKHYYAEVLKALTDELTSETLIQALEAVKAIQDEFDRAEALTVLVAQIDKLAPKKLPQLLEVARAIQDKSSCDWALKTLLDQRAPKKALSQALEDAQAIQDEKYRAKALRALVDKLTPAALPQALEAAQAIEHPFYRAQALMALADKQPDAWFKALEAAQVIRNEVHRVWVLMTLADKLPAESHSQAREAIQAIQYESSQTEESRSRYHELKNISAKFPEALPEALISTKVIQDEFYRARTLMELINKLTPEALPQALEAAQAIEAEYYRAPALSALASHLIKYSSCFSLWKGSMHSLSYRTRPELLSDIAAMTPVIFALSGDDSIKVMEAIQDVANWWP